MRLRAEHANHVWSYDFVEDRTHDGRKYRMLNAVDEFTRECLAIRVARRLKSVDVIEMLAELFMLRDVLGYIAPTMAPEFIADTVQEWIAALGAKTAYIAPGSRGRTAMSRVSMRGCVTSCLGDEIFYTLREARVVIESWRWHYNRGEAACLAWLPGAGAGGCGVAMAGRPLGQPGGLWPIRGLYQALPGIHWSRH